MSKLLRAVSALFLLLTLGSFASSEEAKNDCHSAGGKGVAQFAIQESAGGYDLILPQDLLAKMPAKADYKITIHSTENKSETLTGTGSRIGANVLNVTAPSRFKLPVGRNGLMALDVQLIGIETKAGASCGGCPRDASMSIYGDETICFCLH